MFHLTKLFLAQKTTKTASTPKKADQQLLSFAKFIWWGIDQEFQCFTWQIVFSPDNDQNNFIHKEKKISNLLVFRFFSDV